MQTDDIALGNHFIQRHETARLASLARRVANAHIPAEASQHFDQAPAYLAGAHHAEAASRQGFTPDFG